MDKTYYKAFEIKLLEALVKIAIERRYLSGDIYAIEELNDAWRVMAPYYMADAVPQVADYPMASVAWAGYLGLGVASFWDKDWEQYSDLEQLYTKLIAPRGFDELDEYVMESLLDLTPESPAYEKLEDLMRSLSTECLTMIKSEGFEPQTAEAFQIYARVVKVMYVVGYSIALYEMGYRYHKVAAQFSKDEYDA